MVPVWAMMAVLAACSDTRSAIAARQDGGEVDLSAAAHVRMTADSLAQRADSLVRAGRPWRASALLAPPLRAPATAVPDVRLAGARAAAAWDGWTEVERILRGASWLDASYGGEGRELLARGDLERNVDALPDAQLAATDARDDAARVIRRVLLARALDRANLRDSAAASYAAAAQRLPRVADWLRLRAAGVTTDSAPRWVILRALRDPVARARIAATDAQARERGGDLAGAAIAFATAGDQVASFRTASRAARDDAARSALARRIVPFVSTSSNGSDVRQAIEVLDKLGAPLLDADALIVTRAAAEHGSPARAVAGFQKLMATTTLRATDRLAYAGALVRAGRTADALPVFAALRADSSVAPAAAWQEARALVQAGSGAVARASLRNLLASYPTVQGAAAPALLLLADLQVDDGDLTGATRSLETLAREFPRATQAPLARFRSGLIAWGSDAARAGAIFDSLAARYPADEEAGAARYWSARALERSGRKAEAERTWHELAAAPVPTYYSLLASSRLGASAWAPPAGTDTTAHVAAVDALASQARTLRQLGMDVESRFVLDALAERAEQVPAEASAIAQALVRLDEPSRAMRVAAQALERGPVTRALLRAAYPVLHEDALVEHARRNGLDPAMVAGLIRQESSFTPRAVSVAGARGLMQVMPAVGASIARGRGYPIWNATLLFEPDVNIELGAAHLATTLHRGTTPARALAAYNAGASRVARWSQRPGADDPELFAEWIPFTETRDYVRIVQRNAIVYRALYPAMK